LSDLEKILIIITYNNTNNYYKYLPKDYVGIKGAIKFSEISDFHFKCSSIMTSKKTVSFNTRSILAIHLKLNVMICTYLAWFKDNKFIYFVLFFFLRFNERLLTLNQIGNYLVQYIYS